MTSPAVQQPTSIRPRADSLISIALPAACFAIALAVFCWKIGTPNPWSDESVTYVTVQERDWSGILRLWQGADAPLLPYYLLVKAWTDSLTAIGLPYSIGMIRVLSAVGAASAVLFTYLLLARERGRAAGVVAALILILLPGVSRFAQEARPYALLMGATAFTWWAFTGWNSVASTGDRGRGHPRVGYAAALIVGLVSIPLLSLFGLLQWGAIGILALACPAPVGGWFRRRARLLIPMLVAGAVALVPTAVMAANGTGPARSTPTTLTGLLTTLLEVAYSNRAVGQLTFATSLMVVLLMTSLIALRSPAQHRLLATLWLWLAVPLIGGFVAGYIHPAFVRVRYWMPLVLPAAALMSLGLIELALLSVRALPRGLGKLVSFLTISLVSVTLALQTVPTSEAIRQESGHGNQLEDVLQEVSSLQETYPEARIMIDGNGASYFFAVQAPELFEANILTYADPERSEVWRRVVPPDARQGVLEEAESIIWIHYYDPKPKKTFLGLADEVEEAGLVEDTSAQFRRWTVALYTR